MDLPAADVDEELAAAGWRDVSAVGMATIEDVELPASCEDSGMCLPSGPGKWGHMALRTLSRVKYLRPDAVRQAHALPNIISHPAVK